MYTKGRGKKMELLRMALILKVKTWDEVKAYAEKFKKYDNLSFRDIDDVFNKSQEEGAWFKYF